MSLFNIVKFQVLSACRSPGKIISVIIPTFEALTQFGVATITTQNTGEVEASYSLTVSFTNFSSAFSIEV